jgi:hypothetical protein
MSHSRQNILTDDEIRRANSEVPGLDVVIPVGTLPKISKEVEQTQFGYMNTIPLPGQSRELLRYNLDKLYRHREVISVKPSSIVLRGSIKCLH